MLPTGRLFPPQRRHLVAAGRCAVVVLVWGLGLGVVRAGPDAAGAPLPRDPSGPVCTVGLYRAWSFHAGAPIAAGPAVGSQGQLAVATHAGTLQGLSAAGQLLWSHTSPGPLLTGVHLLSDDRFVAADAGAEVRAIQGDGRPSWVVRAPSTPQALVADPTRGVVLYTRGRGLYALSPSAGLLWSINIGAPVQAPLLLDRQGAVWILTRDRALHRVRTPYFHDRWPVQGSERLSLVGLLPSGALLLDGQRLTALGEGASVSFVKEGIRSAAAVERPLPQEGAPGPRREVATVVVQLVGGGFVWLDAQGREVGRVGAPEFDGELAAKGELVFVLGSEGILRVHTRQGGQGQCRVAHARLLAPGFDPLRPRLVVAGGDGRVASVDYGGLL